MPNHALWSDDSSSLKLAAHLTCIALRVLVPDQYSAQPSSLFDRVASPRFHPDAPQLLERAFIGCNVISLVQSALLGQVAPHLPRLLAP